jgi:pyrroline-5-carboxylate reductase
MMKKIVGFIGCGNMGSAMIKGMIESKIVAPDKMVVNDRNLGKMKSLNLDLGVQTEKSANSLVKRSDIIFLAVKPNVYGTVLNEIKKEFTKDKIFVSIAAGISKAFIENILGDDKKIMRSMPNTPALVGEGMSALSPNQNMTQEMIDEILELFEAFGEAEIIDEYLFHSVIGVSGSSPAYVFKFIEAMADAAVLGGMKREKAYKFAAQAVLGSAKLMLETGKHPAELKDMVCSPGGTTIEAIASLEKNAFSGTVIEAIEACMDKSRDME